jgi:hypothetical protein
MTGQGFLEEEDPLKSMPTPIKLFSEKEDKWVALAFFVYR